MQFLLLVALCGLMASPPAVGDKPVEVAIGAGVVPAKKLFSVLKESKLPIPSSRTGAWIAQVVPGGPADLAGLKKFDIVRKIDDKAIASDQAFVDACRSLRVGKPSKFYIVRIDLGAKKPRWQAQTVVVTPVTKSRVDRLSKATPPIEVTGIALRRNVIGVPEVTVRFKNIAHYDLVAIEVDVACWNRFDEKVMDWSGKTNVYHGISQKTIARVEEGTVSWQLADHETTAKVLVSIVRARLANGTDWKPEKDSFMPASRAELRE